MYIAPITRVKKKSPKEMTPEEYRQFAANTQVNAAATNKHCERRNYTHKKARPDYAPKTRMKRFNSIDLKNMLMMNFRYPEDLSFEFKELKYSLCDRISGKQDPVENKEASRSIIHNTFMFTTTPEGKHKVSRIGFYQLEQIVREVYDHYHNLHDKKT
jgi:hypothetical protein